MRDTYGLGDETQRAPRRNVSGDVDAPPLQRSLPVRVILVMSLCLFASTSFADEEAFSERRSDGTTTHTVYNDTEEKSATMTRSNNDAAGEAGAVFQRGDAEPIQLRRFFLAPVAGIEVGTVGTVVARNNTGNFDERGLTTGIGAGPAYGAVLGWRLGNFSLGARYQGSMFRDGGNGRITGINGTNDVGNLTLHKAYGELGFNSRSGRLIFSGFLDYGWTGVATQNTFHNGMGGKAGVGLDFLVTRFFTIGPGLDFDVHSYRLPAEWVVAYGATATLRVGFQI